MSKKLFVKQAHVEKITQELPPLEAIEGAVSPDIFDEAQAVEEVVPVVVVEEAIIDTIELPYVKVKNEHAELYNGEYYETYAGNIGYGFFEPWVSFFGNIAKEINRLYRPKTVLDIGAALGVLVKSFRDLGISADGIDVSKYAVDRADGLVAQGDLTTMSDSGEFAYDVVTCIEVLEHLPEHQAEQAVRVLSSLVKKGGTLIVSTVPPNKPGAVHPTHLNVQNERYWLALFSKHGLTKKSQAPYISTWAIALAKK